MKSKAGTEIEKINLTIADAKQKAVEEIQKAKNDASVEVASVREKVANELKEVKNKLDQAKVEYADDISSARESSQNEIKRIREETNKLIEDARVKAKTEKEKTKGIYIVNKVRF